MGCDTANETSFSLKSNKSNNEEVEDAPLSKNLNRPNSPPRKRGNNTKSNEKGKNIPSPSQNPSKKKNRPPLIWTKPKDNTVPGLIEENLIKNPMELDHSFKCIQTINAHSKSISCLILLSTGEIVSGGFDNIINIWKRQKNGEFKLKKTLSGHDKGVLSIKEGIKGKTLISGSCDSSIIIWDLKTGECIQNFLAHKKNVLSVDYSDKYNLIASSSDDITVKIWPYKKLKPIKVLKEHEKSIASVIFVDEYNWLCSGGDDMILKVFSVEKNYECIKFFDTLLSEIDCLKYNKNRLLVSCEDGTIFFINAKHLKRIRSVKFSSFPVHDFDVKDREKYLIVASSDCKGRVWRIGTGERFVMSGHRKEINGIAVVDNETIVTGSGDCTIKVWECDLEKDE